MKTFDRVDRARLLAKINALCVDRLTTEWIWSHLTARSSSVRVSDTVGSKNSCPSGVPQGSAIGPVLLFLDARPPPLLPPEVSFKLYADDLKVYSSSEFTDDALIQAAIGSVPAWCRVNNMCISAEKCAVISTLRPCPVFVMDGSHVPAVGSFRDLGVTFSPGLDFSTHIAEIVLAASRVSNFIRRCFIITSPEF